LPCNLQHGFVRLQTEPWSRPGDRRRRIEHRAQAQPAQLVAVARGKCTRAAAAAKQAVRARCRQLRMRVWRGHQSTGRSVHGERSTARLQDDKIRVAVAEKYAVAAGAEGAQGWCPAAVGGVVKQRKRSRCRAVHRAREEQRAPCGVAAHEARQRSCGAAFENRLLKARCLSTRHIQNCYSTASAEKGARRKVKRAPRRRCTTRSALCCVHRIRAAQCAINVRKKVAERQMQRRGKQTGCGHCS
jgi:hypothetical protein